MKLGDPVCIFKFHTLDKKLKSRVKSYLRYDLMRALEWVEFPTTILYSEIYWAIYSVKDPRYEIRK